MLNFIKDLFKNNVNESLMFVNFALGQPNNFGSDQNFVSISYPNFKWGDWSGDTIGEVICQQEIKGKINYLSSLVRLFKFMLTRRHGAVTAPETLRGTLCTINYTQFE